MRSPTSIVDIDRIESWTRYKPGMCNSCAANCCTMPVEVKMADLIRLNLVDPFEAEHEEPKQIAKRLASRASMITSISKTVFLHLHEEAAETVSS
jgi:uncharacterized protein